MKYIIKLLTVTVIVFLFSTLFTLVTQILPQYLGQCSDIDWDEFLFTRLIVLGISFVLSPISVWVLSDGALFKIKQSEIFLKMLTLISIIITLLLSSIFVYSFYYCT